MATTKNTSKREKVLRLIDTALLQYNSDPYSAYKTADEAWRRFLALEKCDRDWVLDSQHGGIPVAFFMGIVTALVSPFAGKKLTPTNKKEK